MPPGTVVSTEVTAGIVGLVRSVRVVGVLEGLMEALDISEAGPDGVPHCSVDPSDALSTQEPSCRSRFLRNFARAFWNQTCRGAKKKGKKQTKSKLLQKGYNWSAHFHYVYEISPLQSAVSKFLAVCEKNSPGPSQRNDEDIQRK